MVTLVRRPITVDVYPMAERRLADVRTIEDGLRLRDLWGRPVGPGDVLVSADGLNADFCLARHQFEHYFEQLPNGRWRSKPTHYAIRFSAPFILRAEKPCAPYVLAQPGRTIELMLSSEGEVYCDERKLLIARFLHDRRFDGICVAQTNELGGYEHSVPLEQPVAEEQREIPRAQCYLAHRRAQFHVAKLVDPAKRTTLFGDPALPGDFEVTKRCGPLKSLVVPSALFSRWFFVPSPDEPHLAESICEVHILRMFYPFELRSGDVSQRGSFGECIVTEYHPLQIFAPRIMTAESVTREFKIVGGGAL